MHAGRRGDVCRAPGEDVPAAGRPVSSGWGWFV